ACCNHGTLIATVGATMYFASGTLTFESNSSLSTATTATVSYTLSLHDALPILSGSTAISGGTANFNGNATSAGGALSGGNLSGSGGLRVSGKSSWDGGW